MPRSAAVVAVLLLAGCASAPPPIPLHAPPTDLALLAGEWAGEYHANHASGRSGSIIFRLEAGSDVARGDVLMHVDGDGSTTLLPPPGEPWRSVPRDRILTITFVRAEQNRVYGHLDPYPDPDCGSEIRTTFTGELRDGVIEGTYLSIHVAGGATTRGTWRVVRR